MEDETQQPILSVCIPTYNRSPYLANCLNAIEISRRASDVPIELCISDNCSTDDTRRVIEDAAQRMPLLYQRNTRNFGAAANILRVVGMARGRYAWVIGDDDILLPHAIGTICALIRRHPEVEFVYANSFHLDARHVFAFAQPFDPVNLPSELERFSTWPTSGEVPFMNLIDPRRSKDWLGGMFLGVFRRDRWNERIGRINVDAIEMEEPFSSLEATYPHSVLWINAFSRARAYFCATPQTVCLDGAREWGQLYPLVRSVRFPELMAEYRRSGLPLMKYFRYRNSMLRGFCSDLVYMRAHKKEAGYSFIRPVRLILRNCFYPNLYWSVVVYIKTKRSGRFGLFPGMAHLHLPRETQRPNGRSGAPS